MNTLAFDAEEFNPEHLDFGEDLDQLHLEFGEDLDPLHFDSKHDLLSFGDLLDTKYDDDKLHFGASNIDHMLARLSI